MSTDTKLKREMDIANLLKPESRVKWEAEHKVCYGLYDDDGLESLMTIDEITVENLDKILESRRNLLLRARFNSHRNPEFFLVWLHKSSLHLMDRMMEKNDYIRAKSMLLQHGHKC